MTDLIERLRRGQKWDGHGRQYPSKLDMKAADELERLQENNLKLGEDILTERSVIGKLRADNTKLQAIADAAADIKWRSIDKDNMEFATSCWKKDALTKALAARKK